MACAGDAGASRRTAAEWMTVGAPLLTGRDTCRRSAQLQLSDLRPEWRPVRRGPDGIDLFFLCPKTFTDGWDNNKQTHKTYGRDSKLRITNNNNTGLVDHDRLPACLPALLDGDAIRQW